MAMILDKTCAGQMAVAQTKLAKSVSQKTIDHTSECF
jgi:hypothetical protein